MHFYSKNPLRCNVVGLTAAATTTFAMPFPKAHAVVHCFFVLPQLSLFNVALFGLYGTRLFHTIDHVFESVEIGCAVFFIDT